MFKKLFKKRKEIVVLHQENGICGSDAKEFAKTIGCNISSPVILVPYGYTLEKIQSKWFLSENGKTRYGSTKGVSEGIQEKLGADLIIVPYGLSYEIYEEE